MSFDSVFFFPIDYIQIPPDLYNSIGLTGKFDLHFCHAQSTPQLSNLHYSGVNL